MKCLFPITAWRSREGQKGDIWPLVFTPEQGVHSTQLKLPCGKCINCRLEHSRRWAIRCIHEASIYNKNCFITLTYNDQNLPAKSSLDKRDFVLFMKKLRKKYGEKIRFFQCGEYGDLTNRPHYHACIFNFDFEDKKHFSTRNGIPLYRSESLEKLWKKGNSLIGEVTFESAAYCARYIMKKITGEPAEAHYQGRLPEYITMSRRPGIGKQWFDKYHADIYNHDILIIRDGIKCRPPKYYDSLYDTFNHDHFKSLQTKRKEKISKKQKPKTLNQILTRSKIAQLKLSKINKGKTL